MVDISIKQTLFPDDACDVTDGKKNNFKLLYSQLNICSNISGLKLNKDKCTILKLGRLRNSKVNLCKDKHFNWTSYKATALRIT